jgi:hypothetical protein
MKHVSVASRRHALQRLGALGLSATPWMGGAAFAAAFMEIEHAQKLLLPQADGFVTWAWALDDAKLNAIAKASDTRIPKSFSPKIWRALQGDKTLGYILSDRVIGKYDLIDYAAGFDTEGGAWGLEILAYRESHGAEVKQTAWRKQFAGKKGPAAMRFADDIRNISGATLSCQHVTEGMQRLSALAAQLVAAK